MMRDESGVCDMETKWLSLSKELHETSINEAIVLLRAGEVVAFPTETVYGLGADARNAEAIEKVFAAKGRPSDNPLIVHIANVNQLTDLVTDIPAYVHTLMERLSPGPITYILKSKDKVARNVTAGLSTVAIRIPNHPVALEILEKSGLPIAAPSANLSGKPSPTSGYHVRDDLNGKIAGIVNGGETAVGLESTVVDCTGDVPMILRLGMITQKDIREVVGEVLVNKVVNNQVKQPKSPGLKYKHYAPEVPLVLVSGDVVKLQQVIYEELMMGKRVGVLASENVAREIKATSVINLGSSDKDIAMNLYKSLRTFKKLDVDIIICEGFSKDGIGEAVMDRLTRAASSIV